MTRADKIVVLRQKRIEQVGSPREVYEDPASSFVAGFIGSPKMNVVEAASAADGTLAVAGARLSPRIATQVAGPVTPGLRPEHLALSAGTEDGLDVVAEFGELLGGTRFLYARLADEQSIVAEHRVGPDVSPGTALRLLRPPEKMRLFSRTGERLR